MSKKQAVIISASPKAQEESTSSFLADLCAKVFRAAGFSAFRVDVRKAMLRGSTETDYRAMLEADALILAFPLYIFCLPGILMRFLQDYLDFCRAAGRYHSATSVYCVVNCGFPEAAVCREALQVVNSFCRTVGAKYRFGLAVGAGGMIISTWDAPFMKKATRRINAAFKSMAADINCNSAEVVSDIYVEGGIPPGLYRYLGNQGWLFTAKSHKIKRKALYSKPYQTQP